MKLTEVAVGCTFPVSLHFSGIPMDVVSHVGAPFFRRNDIHTYRVERLRLVSVTLGPIEIAGFKTQVR